MTWLSEHLAGRRRRRKEVTRSKMFFGIGSATLTPAISSRPAIVKEAENKRKAAASDTACCFPNSAAGQCDSGRRWPWPHWVRQPSGGLANTPILPALPRVFSELDPGGSAGVCPHPLGTNVQVEAGIFAWPCVNNMRSLGTIPVQIVQGRASTASC